jgi:hypothetical protein
VGSSPVRMLRIAPSAGAQDSSIRMRVPSLSKTAHDDGCSNGDSDCWGSSRDTARYPTLPEHDSGRRTPQRRPRTPEADCARRVIPATNPRPLLIGLASIMLIPPRVSVDRSEMASRPRHKLVGLYQIRGLLFASANMATRHLMTASAGVRTLAPIVPPNPPMAHH